MYSQILQLNLLTTITSTVGVFYFSKENNYWVVYILIYNYYTYSGYIICLNFKFNCIRPTLRIL